MTEKPTVITLTDEEVDRYISGLADVIQWLHGFQAGLPDDSPKRMPSDWRVLSDINAKLKSDRRKDLPF